MHLVAAYLQLVYTESQMPGIWTALSLKGVHLQAHPFQIHFQPPIVRLCLSSPCRATTMCR